MPKQKLHISTFQGIVAPAADAGDLTPGSAAYAEDVDLISMPGTVQGLPKHWRISSPSDDTVEAPVVLSYGDDDPYIVYYNRVSGGDDRFLVKRFPGAILSTRASFVQSDTDFPYPIDSSAHRNSVRFGMGAVSEIPPVWIGFVEHGQFGTPAPSAVQIEDAHLARHDQMGFDAGSVSDGSTTSGETPFTAQRVVGYDAALVYDDFQEGPLWDLTFHVVGGNDVSSLSFTLEYDDSVALSSRVSAIAIYRTLDTDIRSGQEHVQTIRLDAAGWSAGGPGQQYEVIDNGTPGMSYEERTGLLPSYQSQRVEYALSARADAYHFVADCRVETDEASHRTTIFRSKAYRPDMFDWANDFLVLPEQPTALHYWNGRLLAFSEAAVYLIDPETLQVSEQLTGYGTFRPQSVCSSKRGVFWVNADGMYLYDGTRIRHVSQPIDEAEDPDLPSWRGESYAAGSRDSGPQCIFDVRNKMYIVLLNTLSGEVVGWGLYLPDERWTELIEQGTWTRLTAPVDQGTLSPFEAFCRVQDEVFLFSPNNFYLMFRDETRSAWTWRSPRIDLDAPAHEKVFYAAYLQGNETLEAGGTTLRWRSGDGDWSSPRDTGSMTERRGQLHTPVNSASNGPYEAATDVQIEIAGGEEARLRSCSVEYRPKRAAAFTS